MMLVLLVVGWVGQREVGGRKGRKGRVERVKHFLWQSLGFVWVVN